MPLNNILIISFSAIFSLICYATAQRNRYAATVTEAMGIIAEEFIEPVETRDLFESAMDGMVQDLDQYSGFISRDDFAQFQESLDQNFGGIGIIVDVDAATNRLTVTSPMVNTPAFRAGIRGGDIILEIDSTTTEGMSLRDAVGFMRGPPGSPVHLRIQHRDKQIVEMDVERAVIPVQSVKGDRLKPDGRWIFHLAENSDIGYIRISTFGEKTVSELKDALKFENGAVKAIVIDLRNNAGGLLSAAVATCDTFIDGGKIVTTRGRGGVERRREEATKAATIVDPDVDVVVLVNHFSASASEIVAACLQDHKRAYIVGERTWGKGTVQNIIELEGGKSALKLTTATYWRPTEKNIHRSKSASESDDWGVRPNDGNEIKIPDEEVIAIAKDRQRRDILPNEGEEPPTIDPADAVVDPQLQHAIEYLNSRLQEGDSVNDSATGDAKPEEKTPPAPAAAS